jgi:hypothetical protein
MVNMQLPDGFHLVDLVTESRHEDSETCCEAEVLARWHEAASLGASSETIVCGWCGSSKEFFVQRTKPSLAVRWFHEHPCKYKYAEASTGVTNELTPERASAPLAA